MCVELHVAALNHSSHDSTLTADLFPTRRPERSHSDSSSTLSIDAIDAIDVPGSGRHSLSTSSSPFARPPAPPPPSRSPFLTTSSRVLRAQDVVFRSSFVRRVPAISTSAFRTRKLPLSLYRSKAYTNFFRRPSATPVNRSSPPTSMISSRSISIPLSANTSTSSSYP